MWAISNGEFGMYIDWYIIWEYRLQCLLYWNIHEHAIGIVWWEYRHYMNMLGGLLYGSTHYMNML